MLKSARGVVFRFVFSLELSSKLPSDLEGRLFKAFSPQKVEQHTAAVREAGEGISFLFSSLLMTHHPVLLLQSQIRWSSQVVQAGLPQEQEQEQEQEQRQEQRRELKMEL